LALLTALGVRSVAPGDRAEAVMPYAGVVFVAVLAAGFLFSARRRRAALAAMDEPSTKPVPRAATSEAWARHVDAARAVGIDPAVLWLACGLVAQDGRATGGQVFANRLRTLLEDKSDRQLLHVVTGRSAGHAAAFTGVPLKEEPYWYWPGSKAIPPWSIPPRTQTADPPQIGPSGVFSAPRDDSGSRSAPAPMSGAAAADRPQSAAAAAGGSRNLRTRT
jgi:hypothetical protein